MFGLFSNKPREYATQCLRLMVLVRHVQNAIDLEMLEAIGRKHGLTFIVEEDNSKDVSNFACFPEMYGVVRLEHPTSEVESLQLLGAGPLYGLLLIMRRHTDQVNVSVMQVRGATSLAYKTALELRRVGDVSGSLVPNAFNASFDLDTLADSGEQKLGDKA